MKSYAALLALLVAASAAACSSSSSPPANAGGDDGGGGGDGAAVTADTWDNWAQGFFTKYCVECHAAGNTAGLDFGQQSIVVANKDTIRCGVCVSQDPSWNCPASPPAEQFPIYDTAKTNPKPTDDERNRVVAWITAGCP